MTAGILMMVLARELRVSAIVVLLIGGVALGPELLGWVNPRSLGDGLRVIVQLSVALILFEGGLTLDLHGYRRASGIIRRLLTVGVAITWVVTALAIHLLFGQPLPFCFLAASLVVVTGPTVISPLLRRVRVKQNVHNALYWEGVLVDPVGVFLAVMCYELVAAGSTMEEATRLFALRFAVGLGIGGVAGLMLDQVIRRMWIHPEQINIFAFATALITFGACDRLAHESGLLGVIVAGFILGARRPKPLERIRRFKLELTEMLIGNLFVLLSANLSVAAFLEFGWRGALLVLLVLLVARPACVFASGMGTDFTRAEKLFLSWVAPRGIVAASMGSFFALQLTAQGDERGAFLETFTYSIIGATVILQGSSAGWVARRLGLNRPAPNGYMIIGAHRLGCELSRFITEVVKRPCLVLDANPRAVEDARARGVVAEYADALDPGLRESDIVAPIGGLLAATDNEHLNSLICQQWEDSLNPGWDYRWARAAREGDLSLPGKVVWPTLPKPSVVAAELDRGEAGLQRIPLGDATGMGEDATILAVSQDGRLSFHPEEWKEAKPTSEALILWRRSVRLSSHVQPETVLVSGARDVEALFSEMLDALAKLEPALDRARVYDELLEREHNLSTAIGHWVAIPHCSQRGLPQPRCAIALVPAGVDFGAYDGVPVKLVFLLISPPEDPERHLVLLAEIAHIAADPGTVEKMTAAGSSEELYRLLQDVEARLPRGALLGGGARTRARAPARKTPTSAIPAPPAPPAPAAPPSPPPGAEKDPPAAP